MILQVSNINKYFNDNHILKDVSFHMNEYDKTALVGINGSGKTTLIRIIMNELDKDGGNISLNKGVSVGYLPQNAIIDSDATIYEEVLKVKEALISDEQALRDMEKEMGDVKGRELEVLMEDYHKLEEAFDRAGGYRIASDISGTLKGLGFSEEEFGKPVNTLSGGQKTRVALSKLLVGTPDMIILDEPTNHLDMNSIIWLENYLLNYKGAVLIVSHDRYFLDRIVDHVVELDCGVCTSFTGNYSDYAAKKEIIRVSQLNAYLNQQRDIKHQQEVIEKLRSFNREKSIKRADSRAHMLEKIELIDKPTENNNSMQIVLSPRIESGKNVLDVTDLTKAYDHRLFTDINFSLRRGDHVAIIGDNGTGKTTILKIINNIVSADSGKIKLGTNVCIGYYDQEHHVLHDDKTIFEEISDDFPTLTNTEIRNMLAAFLFTGDDVFKPIHNLSGGEKGRVSLAKLMLSEANLLILDEPTNHLDITSKEILENALNNYTGTLLYVSHDRYFINRTADRILELNSEGLTEYLGNYDYYLEKKQENTTSAGSLKISSNNIKNEAAALDYKAQKAEAARIKKLNNDLNKLEDKIAHTEQAISDIDAWLNDSSNGTDTAGLIKKQKEKESLDEELLILYDKWEELSSLL
ncbi:ribosomal protection-like ABC-F family protein [Lacrimispora saccharolytica]|uniref:ribosomal protection-like ABC-F family protein n=1 Tax=Lacrimispora saccharolytica TaxID=84030 RepID=UPI00265D092B|nr:ATP-binding cassette domain-containing protein [Lacrimispora saccharolytica]MCF2656155.1 ATP-binding cassette domain-containing protein [Lacrimispora saccharolytica]